MTKVYNNASLQIRPANKEDMSAVAEMLQEWADFEEMLEPPKISAEDLVRDGFVREPPAFRCNVAVCSSSKEKLIIGYAIYFSTYSWEGVSMMLENLYVRPVDRNKGIGQKLFKSVVQETIKIGSNRLDFRVFAWNRVRSFCEKTGAIDLTNTKQSCYYRLTGDALRSCSSEID